MFTIKDIISREGKVSKGGKPYVSFIFSTTDGKRVSGFGGKGNEAWKAGDTIQDDTAVIVQKGQYWNLEMKEKPKASSSNDAAIMKSLDEIHNKLDEINTKILKILNTATGDDIPL